MTVCESVSDGVLDYDVEHKGDQACREPLAQKPLFPRDRSQIGLSGLGGWDIQVNIDA